MKVDIKAARGIIANAELIKDNREPSKKKESTMLIGTKISSIFSFENIKYISPQIIL